MMIVKKYKVHILTCILVVLVAFQGSTQEKWTLVKCVNHAIQNNVQIQQQALNVNYSENILDMAKYDRLPNLNAGSSYRLNLGRTLSGLNTYTDESSSTIQFGINSEVTIFNGMAKSNTIKKRNIEYKAALKDLEKAKDDISLYVVSAYLEILFNKELLATSKDQLELTNQQIEYNTKQVEAGNMARGKLFETEAQAANEALTVANYENQLQISLLNLAQVLEIELTDDFDIITPEFDEEQLVVELLKTKAVFAKAVTSRPEIQSKELNLQSAKINSEIVKAQKLPSLVAGANYGTYYNTSYTQMAVDETTGAVYDTGEKISFSDQLDNYRSGSVYLSLNIPIFNRFSAKINHQNSMVSYESAKLELELEKNNLLKEIQQVRANAIAAMKKYEASEKAAASAEEAFRYVEEKFKLGIVTPLEYNDAKNKVTNAQSSFIQAKYEYIFRIKILDFYNGNPITL